MEAGENGSGGGAEIVDRLSTARPGTVQEMGRRGKGEGVTAGRIERDGTYLALGQELGLLVSDVVGPRERYGHVLGHG